MMIGKIGALVFYTIAVLLVFNIGRAVEYWEMHQQAIQHGVAHYDQKTGDFTWGLPPTVLEEMPTDLTPKKGR